MSKTKGNVIYADDLADIFGVDAVRYFVVHEMPYENDGVITWELVVERINSDLANTMGNLVNRTIAMSNKYFDGVVADKGVAEPVDDDLKAFVTAAYDKVEAKRVKTPKTSGVTGYAIYYSTNKNMSNAKKIVVKKNYTNKPISVVKGKTYYIKVVPFKQQNGKTYWGASSAVTAVKAK